MIEKPSENITYYYSEFQNTFGEIQTLVPQIKFVQGLPDDILDTINPETRNLFIVDDMMGEKDAVIAKLFTKKSHHGNLSVIYIVQNLFHHSKEHRTISLNASYLCLTKNVRDASQIVHLAKQLYNKCHIYHDRRKGRILGSICTKTWILQSELYSVFEQTLQHIHVEQKSFASRIIRRLWTIRIILCATSM